MPRKSYPILLHLMKPDSGYHSQNQFKFFIHCHALDNLRSSWYRFGTSDGAVGRVIRHSNWKYWYADALISRLDKRKWSNTNVVNKVRTLLKVVGTNWQAIKILICRGFFSVLVFAAAGVAAGFGGRYSWNSSHLSSRTSLISLLFSPPQSSSYSTSQHCFCAGRRCPYKSFNSHRDSALRSCPVRFFTYFWRDRDRDRSIYIPEPQKTGLDRLIPVFFGLDLFLDRSQF